MAIRSDEHRPSVINPKDYVFVGLEYYRHNAVDFEGYYIPIVLSERSRINLHMQKTGGKFSEHKKSQNNCQVCGVHIHYKAVFYHNKTNVYIRTGLDCAEKLNMGDANRFRIFKDAILAAKHHRAGKAKAIGFLTEKNLERAWQIYRAIIEIPEMEKAFIQAMKAEPDEVVHKMAYADWLMENGQEHRMNNLLEKGIADYPYEERTIADVVEKLVRYGDLSDKQVNFISHLLHKIDDRPNAEKRKKEIELARELEKSSAADVPNGKQTLTVEVLSVKYQQPKFHGQAGRTVMLVKSVIGGFKLWGTVPSNCITVQDSEGSRPLDKGDRLELTANIIQSENDSKFGFFKRPTGVFLSKKPINI
jgi:uncharacterized protein (TIGR02996 family)